MLLLLGAVQGIYAQEPYAVLSADNTTLTFYYDNNKEANGGMDVGPFTREINWDTWEYEISSGWFEQHDNITTVVFDESFANYTELSSTAYWFYDCSNLSTIDGLENLKTANITNMSYLFYKCSSLTSLDLSNFNTANVTDMNKMFYGCPSLTSLDVSNFNTTKVTNMSGMFYGCSSLTSLDVSKFNTANVTDMNNMFYGCSSLTSLDVSKFNTGNVTDMSYMFEECSSLTSLNISKFNTANVINMGCMFAFCSSLTSLDVSNFNTANVTEMFSMFAFCSSLTSLDVSNFNTANVTIMGSMFQGCSSLTSLDVSNFNTDNVTDMYYMFSRCSSLTSLDVSNFNTTNVTFLPGMFEECSGLTSLDVSNFNTANVTEMFCMFQGCSSLTSLDVSNFNTTNVTTMSSMFEGCSSLSNLNLSSFNTTRVEYMSGMFEDCSSLTNLNISKFKTANVTDMSNMFYNCNSLTSLDVSKFNTANVTDMSKMFYNCNSLTSLDVSNFNTANVTDMSKMFYDCHSLTSLDVSNFNTTTVKDMSSMFERCYGLTSLDLRKFNTDKVTNMSYMFLYCYNLTTIYSEKSWSCISSNGMFSECTSLNGAISFDSRITDITGASPINGYFTATGENPYPYAVLSKDNKTLTFYYDNNKETNGGMDVGPFKNKTNSGWYEHRYDITKVVFDKSFANYNHLFSTAYWFNYCKYLTTIEGIENLNTDNVTNMRYMFYDCSSLKSLYVGNFNIANVTDMCSMFEGCSSLKKIYCNDTWSCDDSDDMFEDCTSLVGAISYDSEKTDVTYANPTTGYFTAISEDPSPYAVLSENNETLSFYYDNKKEINGGMDVGPLKIGINWDTYQEEIDSEWYSQRDYIKKVVIDESFANYTDLTSTAYWFYDCTKLKTIEGIENLNTTNVTDMRSMFYHCTALRKIYCNDTWSCDYSYNMFYGCYSLEGAISFDSDKTDVTYANPTTGYFTATSEGPSPYAVLSSDNTTLTFFYDNNKEANGGMDVGPFKAIGMNWDTYEYEINSGWYEHYSDITTVVFDKSFANYNDLSSTAYWFYSFRSLTTIDGIENLNTSNVKNMRNMFYHCSSLTNLDLSNFNTSNVTDMYGMFEYSQNLEKIYCNDTWSCDNSEDMFYACNALVGAISYDGDKTDATYANPTTGYFTKKTTEIVLGDANGDGEVTMSDVIAIMRYILGDIPTGSNFDSAAADVNGDGFVTVADALMLQDTVKGTSQNP